MPNVRPKGLLRRKILQIRQIPNLFVTNFVKFLPQMSEKSSQSSMSGLAKMAAISAMAKGDFVSYLPADNDSLQISVVFSQRTRHASSLQKSSG